MEHYPLSIRGARKEDLSAARRICEETASISCETDAQRSFLQLVYCDPYIETQTEHCFVAVDQQDQPLGYILCAPDTKAFLRLYRRDYLPRIDSLGLQFALQGRFAQTVHAALAGKYAAHLHIDLSEKARHQGIGSALMNSLKSHLSSIDVHTLFLSCDGRNENAVRFYLRNGFSIKASLFGMKIMICHF